MIHTSSVIDSKAKIPNNVKIGPFCFIEGDIEIGDNTEIVSHSGIFGNTKSFFYCFFRCKAIVLRNFFKECSSSNFHF